jgi:hypothetical protein
LRIGSDILTHIARYSPDEKRRDVVSRSVAESAQNLMAMLRGLVVVYEVKKVSKM